MSGVNGVPIAPLSPLNAGDGNERSPAIHTSPAAELGGRPEHRVQPLLHRVAEVGRMVTAPSMANTRLARGIAAGVAEFGRHPALAELTP